MYVGCIYVKDIVNVIGVSFPLMQKPSLCTGPMELNTLMLLMLLGIIIYLILLL